MCSPWIPWGGPKSKDKCYQRHTEEEVEATWLQRPDGGVWPGARERLEPKELEEVGRSPLQPLEGAAPHLDLDSGHSWSFVTAAPRNRILNLTPAVRGVPRASQLLSSGRESWGVWVCMRARACACGGVFTVHT